MKSNSSSPNGTLDRVVAAARQSRDKRDADYREQALKLYPWICGRCAREFNRLNLHELTVHHRDHNHDHNPADGSNWELLCLFCHDNEHQRHEEALSQAGTGSAGAGGRSNAATFNPFANLKTLLETGKKDN